MPDYCSFEEVMTELEVTEDDLKRMVSEGELRAFRDENKMKFKREDIEGLKRGRITEPTIILPSSPRPEGGRTETVIDFDMGEKEGEGFTDGTAVDLPTDDVSTGGTTIGAGGTSSTEVGPTRTMKIETTETSDISIDPTETYIDEEEDSALVTEPLKLADEQQEADSSGFTAELVEDAPPPPAAVRPALKKKKKEIATIPPEIEAELERRRPSFVWSVLMGLTLIISLVSVVFFYDLMRLESNRADQPMSFTGDMAESVIQKYWADPEILEWHESEKVPEESRLRRKLNDPENKNQAEEYYLGKEKLGPTFRHKVPPPGGALAKPKETPAEKPAEEKKE